MKTKTLTSKPLTEKEPLCASSGHKWEMRGGMDCRKCANSGIDMDAPDHGTAVMECSNEGCGAYYFEDYPYCNMPEVTGSPLIYPTKENPLYL